MSAPVVAVVLSNIAFVAGAVVVMILVSTVLVLRQRKPKSVEANVESFNRGLRALAPTPAPQRRRPAAPVRPAPGAAAGRPTEVDPG